MQCKIKALTHALSSSHFSLQLILVESSSRFFVGSGDVRVFRVFLFVKRKDMCHFEARKFLPLSLSIMEASILLFGAILERKKKYNQIIKYGYKELYQIIGEKIKSCEINF